MAHIDVLMPVKNTVQYLADSIDSVCQQRFNDWHLHILDHGSTDGSFELAQRFAERDRRIKIHRFADADGLPGLLNHGIDVSDCRYLMRHDADDICMPDRMNVVLDAFQQLSGYVAIGGQADAIDGQGRFTRQLKMPVGRQRVAVGSFFRNPFLHPCIMLDFRYMQTHGERYGVDFLGALQKEQRLEVSTLVEDYFIFGQLAIEGKCTNLPVRLIKNRWHDTNISVLRIAEQMELSLKVSRYLAKSFSAIYNLPYFDPAPFCNHGAILLDVNGKKDYLPEFERMATALRQAYGHCAEVERELAYRGVTATRREAHLLWRYCNFQKRYPPENGEWNAICAWLVRDFPGKRRGSRTQYIETDAFATGMERAT